MNCSLQDKIRGK